MNTYEVSWCERYSPSVIVAKTASKAKAECYRTLGQELGFDFFTFVEMCTVRLRHKFKVSDLYSNYNGMFERMKHQRNLPDIFIGQRVVVDGKKGTICGSNESGNLDVCFDGDTWTNNCHPHWRVEYLNEQAEG